MPKPEPINTPQPHPGEPVDPRETEDAHLVARAVGGDETSFEILVTRYTPLVASFLYEKTGSEADTEDLAQEVFLTAYRGMDRLRDGGHFRPWLMQIARSKAIDFHRYNGRRPRVVTVVPMGEDGDEIDLLETVPDRAPSANQRLRDDQTAHIVLRETEKIKDKYRVVLQMRLIGEITTQEIAIRLNMKESTVRMRLHRGLKILRKRLERLNIGFGGEGDAQ